MEAAIEHMDVQYEVAFSEPLFDLPRRNVEVLESFYNNLKPGYLASPSDMQVAGGTSLSDVKVRVTMFGGLATLEVTIDRMLVEFRRVKSLSDFNTCKLCTLASEKAIWGIYPELRINRTAFNFDVHIKLNGNKSADQLLRDVGGYGNNIDLSQFGDVEQFPAANITILNEQKRWNSVFHAYAMLSDRSGLIASFRSSYTEAETDQGLDHRLNEFTSRTEDLHKLFKILLGGIGINSADLDWEARKEGSHDT